MEPLPMVVVVFTTVMLAAGVVFFIGRLIRRMAQARQDQQASEARLRDFAEISSDWFWEMDENLRFT